MFLKVFCILFVLHYTHSAVMELSCKDIITFVGAHNVVRHLLAQGKIQGLPPAVDMNTVTWDNELAEKAAKWAASYPKSVDPDQTIPSGRFSVSQSISVLITNKLDFKVDPETLLVMWYNEHRNYTYGPFSKESIAPTHPPIGHFTQMVWSNSIYLGCAISEQIESDMKKTYIVCEYGPSANILGQRPYKSGEANNKLICSAGAEHCKYPSGKKCSGE